MKIFILNNKSVKSIHEIFVSSASRNYPSFKSFFFIVILINFIFLSISSDNIFAFEQVKFIKEISSGLTKPIDIEISQHENIYVIDETSSKVIAYNKKWEQILEFGKRGSEPGQFHYPKSIAISNLGKIIVADTGNNRIQVFDIKGNFLFQFGSPGSLHGQFRAPVGVVVDQFGFIFVADRDNRRIQVFSPNGVFLYLFETDLKPVDISIDSHRNLYIMLPDFGKILQFSPNGKRIRGINCVMNSTDYIRQAQGIEVDHRGDIYITENFESSIKKININEEILISFGSKGQGRGQFDKLAGICSDKKGYIFIADTNNNRIQIFKIKGNNKKPLVPIKQSPLKLDYYSEIIADEAIVGLFAKTGEGLYVLSNKNNYILFKGNEEKIISEPGKNPGQLFKSMAICATLDKKIYIADTGNHRVQIFNLDGSLDYEFGKNGSSLGQFSSPYGVAVNSKGIIYVSDTNNNRIQYFTNDGIFLNSFGDRKGLQNNSKRKPDENELLNSPRSIAINSLNWVYVLDYENSQIQIYDENGNFLKSIGRNGSKYSMFNKPSDIAIDENDNLYVADQGNYRIQIFNSKGDFLFAFGAPGQGKGYFKEISAITVAASKIYVADYKEKVIQIFRYLPEGNNRKKRIYSTKTVKPPDDIEENDIVKYTIAKNTAIQMAIKELKGDLNISKSDLKKSLKIESIEIIANGQIKVTVSISKSILPNLKEK